MSDIDEMMSDLYDEKYGALKKKIKATKEILPASFIMDLVMEEVKEDILCDAIDKCRDNFTVDQIVEIVECGYTSEYILEFVVDSCFENVSFDDFMRLVENDIPKNVTYKLANQINETVPVDRLVELIECTGDKAILNDLHRVVDRLSAADQKYLKNMVHEILG